MPRALMVFCVLVSLAAGCRSTGPTAGVVCGARTIADARARVTEQDLPEPMQEFSCPDPGGIMSCPQGCEIQVRCPGVGRPWTAWDRVRGSQAQLLEPGWVYRWAPVGLVRGDHGASALYTPDPADHGGTDPCASPTVARR